MALILSRRVKETIVIAEKIVIRVVEIRGSRVKLLIEAAPDIPVVRGELVDENRVPVERGP